MKNHRSDNHAAPPAALTPTSAVRSVNPERLHTQWLHDESALLSLKTDWNRLADLTDPQSLFLRYEWCDAAWQWRKHDAALEVLCVRNDSEVVGIAPLLRTRRRRRGITVQSLEFLAIPDTQFCDVLAAAPWRAAVLGTLVETLAARHGRWDLLELNRMRAGSPTHAALRENFLAHGLPCTAWTNDINLSIDLTQTWPDFYAQRSRRLKKANNLVANRLQRAVAQISIERMSVAGTAAENVNIAVTDAIALSARSWKQETGVSLDRPGPGAFFRRLVDHANTNDWLVLWFLRLNQQPAAMEIQVVHRGQVHALRSDFDQALMSHSPGSYLNWKLLESQFGRGLERYWFGPGENSYKLHWTDTGERLHALVAYHRTWRGRWLAFLEMSLLPKLKRWLRRNRPTPADAAPANED